MAIQQNSPLAGCRHAGGYTQETFAEKLGVDRSTVGRWERGVQSPQPWQRPDLAAALDISLDHLDDILRRTRRASDALVTAEFDVLNQRFQLVDDADRGEPEVTSTFSGDDAVRAAVPRLRRALDSIDLPDDGPTRPL